MTGTSLMAIRTSRLRQVGWVAILAVCLAGFVALSFRTSAVKSEVRLAEREIIGLKREIMVLETEFQTRANQHQLARWNALEFGYVTPTAGQYFGDERRLAELGLPTGPRAPAPIRVARAPGPEPVGPVAALVSPLTGRPVGEEPTAPARQRLGRAKPPAPLDLAERLALPAAYPEETAATPGGDAPAPGSAR